MRNVVQYEFSDPGVLRIADVPTPTPLPTEVLVRTHAVGLNPLETRLRVGENGSARDLPLTLGWDISGVVEHAATWRLRSGDGARWRCVFRRARTIPLDDKRSAHQAAERPQSV